MVPKPKSQEFYFSNIYDLKHQTDQLFELKVTAHRERQKKQED